MHPCTLLRWTRSLQSVAGTGDARITSTQEHSTEHPGTVIDCRRSSSSIRNHGVESALSTTSLLSNSGSTLGFDPDSAG